MSIEVNVVVGVGALLVSGFAGAIGADFWGIAKLMPRRLARRYRRWRIERVLNQDRTDPLQVHMFDENGEPILAELTEETRAAHERGVQKRRGQLGL